MDYSEALRAMKERGARVARASWREPGKYVYWQPARAVQTPDGRQRTLVGHCLFVRPHKGTVEPWLPSFDAQAADDWYDVDKQPAAAGEPLSPGALLVLTDPPTEPEVAALRGLHEGLTGTRPPTGASVEQILASLRELTEGRLPHGHYLGWGSAPDAATGRSAIGVWRAEE